MRSRILKTAAVVCATAKLLTVTGEAVGQDITTPVPPIATILNGDLNIGLAPGQGSSNIAEQKAVELCAKMVVRAQSDPDTSFRLAVQSNILAPVRLTNNDETTAPQSTVYKPIINILGNCGFEHSKSPDDRMEERVVAFDYGSIYVSAYSNLKFSNGVKTLLRSRAYRGTNNQRLNFSQTRSYFETGELSRQNPALARRVAQLAAQNSGVKIFPVNLGLN